MVNFPAILVERFMGQMGKIGVDAADDSDLQLQKILLLSLTVRFIVVAALLGICYLLLGEPVAASILLNYAIISSVSVIAFHRTHNFPLFRFSQLLLLFLLPFLLTVALGGFFNASGFVIWAMLCPFGALLFTGMRSAIIWFITFGLFLIGSGLLQPLMPASNHLPPGVITIFFVLNTFAVTGLAFTVLYFFILQREKALELLKLEREKSEHLLLNVLPGDIARILRDDDRTIADYFDAATILFADVANFTPLSASMNPTDVVNLLNEIFSYFDSLAEKYQLEKIKTIGDCYMVAAGVPKPRADHAQTVARMALDMSGYVMTNPAYGDSRIDFRIGIHSGPVVAGVIGRKKFIYDLWGDSVNTASRMESHGIPGKIQISAETYSLIRGEFVCDPRGMVTVKGKGEMETWYLVGEKQQPVPTI